jgi:integrase
MGRPPHPVGTSGRVRSYRSGSGWRSRTTVRDHDGVTREIQRAGRTKAEAERKLAIAIRERTHVTVGTAITPDTKLAMAAEVWFADLRELDRSPSTLQMYRDRLDRQVLPALGNIRLRELTVGRVDAHLKAVKTSHGPAVAKLTRSVLSGICGVGTRHDALTANPVRDVTRISTKPKNPPRSLSVAEIQQLRAYLSYDDVAVGKDLPDLVAFMVATGMRIGEVCALTWSDIDFPDQTVAVRGTVLRLTGHGLLVKRPKTTAGHRTLELPSWAVSMLRRRAAAPPGGNPVSAGKGDNMVDCWVFPTELGNLRDPANTRRDLREAFIRAGYHGLTSHTFRKTTASLMDAAGLSARAAADQLGHSKVSQTQDTYYGRKVRKTGAADALEVLGSDGE